MIEYEKEIPAFAGTYACRIDGTERPGLLKDIFLIWVNEEWYTYSGQPFQGKVYGWIGPLRRTI